MDAFSIPALVSRLWTLDSAGAWHLAGWTMLHFLWVGAAIAVAAAVLRVAFRPARSQVRYLAALAMLAVVAAAPAIIAAGLLHVRGADFAPQAPRGRESFFAADGRSAVPLTVLPRKKTPDPVPAADEPISQLLTEPTVIAPGARTVLETAPASRSEFRSSQSTFETAAGVLPYVWLVGAPCMLLLLGTGLVGGERLRRRSHVISEGPLAEALQQLRQHFGGRAARRLAVAVCDRVASPVLVGIVRPLVLFPPAAVTGWTPEQIEMILLHELAHVRRWDNLVNLVQRLIESLLFFHPAVWWLSGWVRQEREHCCDAFVIHQLQLHSRQSPRRSYARLLLELAAADRPRPATAAGTAFAARNLKTRVRHILSMEEQPMRISLKTLLATLTVAIVTIALTTTAARGLVNSQSESERAAEAPAIDGQPIEDSLPPDPVELTAPSPAEEAADHTGESHQSLADLREEYKRAEAELNSKRQEYFDLVETLGGSSDANNNVQVKMLLSRWTANRRERREVQNELANAYMVFQAAAMQHNDPAVLERLAEEAVTSNPFLQQLKSQMLWLDTLITKSKISSGNRRSRGLARLEEQKEQLSRQIEQIETQERARLKSEYENSPNLVKELLRKQYEAKAEIYRDRIEALDEEAARISEELKRLTKRNQELVERMHELTKLAGRNDALGKRIIELEAGTSKETPDQGADGRPPTREQPSQIDLKQVDGQELLALPVGAKLILQLDARVPRIQVNEPDLVSARALSADRIELEGKQAGEATVNLWDESGTMREVTIFVYQTIAAETDEESRGEATSEESIKRSAWEQLGIRLEQAAAANLRRFRGGLRVTAVNNDGPADVAKIREGDVLVGLRRWAVASIADLDYVLDRAREQDEREIKFYVIRDGSLLYGQLRPAWITANGESPEVESPAGQTDDPQLVGTGINSDAGVVGTVVADPNLTYDGKDFDYWKDVWRTELKTERRTEAIRALAAFGAHGYGREAAETILDVVKNYDLANLHPGQPESVLVEAAVDAFVGGGVRIPLEEGLDVLLKRVLKGEPSLTSFAGLVVRDLPATEPAVAEHVFAFAASDATELQATATRKLRDMYVHVSEKVQERIADQFRVSMTSDDANVAITGIGGLYPGAIDERFPDYATKLRAGYVPELLHTLQHENTAVRQATVDVFKALGDRAKQAVPELRELFDNASEGVKYTLVAALRHIGPAASSAAPELLAYFESTGNVEVREFIIRSLADMRAAPEVVFEYYLGGDPVEVFPVLA